MAAQTAQASIAASRRRFRSGSRWLTRGGSEQRLLRAVVAAAAVDAPEVLVGAPRRDPPARRPLEEAELQQVRLVHVLYGVDLFGDRGRDRVDPDWATGELV